MGDGNSDTKQNILRFGWEGESLVNGEGPELIIFENGNPDKSEPFGVSLSPDGDEFSPFRYKIPDGHQQIPDRPQKEIRVTLQEEVGTGPQFTTLFDLSDFGVEENQAVSALQIQNLVLPDKVSGDGEGRVAASGNTPKDFSDDEIPPENGQFDPDITFVGVLGEVVPEEELEDTSSFLAAPEPQPAGPPDIIADRPWDNPGNTVVGTNNDDAGLPFGEDGDQTLEGEDGVNNRIIAGNGDDEITGGDQNDRLNGGEGDDTINGGDGDDRLGGDSGNDTLNGDGGDDVLWGNGGDDALNGGAGNDELHGGAGSDRLTGGDGADTFYFDGRGDDVITDFQAGNPEQFAGNPEQFDTLELPGLDDFEVENIDNGVVLSFGEDQGTLTVLGVDSVFDLGIA